MKHRFKGTPLAEEVRLVKSAREAFQLVRVPENYAQRREDWKEVKDSVMLKALRAKFGQHQDLQELLLSTGDATLIEHTENDVYWADGGDGSGKNKLGQLLMKVRQEFMQIEEQ